MRTPKIPSPYNLQESFGGDDTIERLSLRKSPSNDNLHGENPNSQLPYPAA